MHTLRRIVHGVTLLAVFSLAFFVLLDVLILIWGYWPVSQAAMSFENYTIVFAIAPGEVGESTWTGWGAFVAGAVLFFIGLALFKVQREGKMPGLAGIGTRILALLFGISGVGVLAFGGYLAATGHMMDGVAVPTIFPTPVGLMVLQFTLLVQWHSIMIGAILMSVCVMLIVDTPVLVREARRSLSKLELPTLRTDNTWIVIFRMYMAIVGFYLIYNILLGLFTVSPEVPDFAEQPLWHRLHSFAVASVWEEILVRVLMLGLPLLVYHVLADRKEASVGRYLVGGGFKIDNAAFVLIFVSSMVFALAHVAGWDLWKVLPTVISGFAFGYLFLKRGLWAAIILHFTFDYLGMTTDVLIEWGIDITLLFNLFFFFWALTGVVLLIHYLVIIIDEGPEIVRTSLWGPRPEAETGAERFNGPQNLGASDKNEGPQEGPPRGHDEAPGGERR